MVQLYLSQVGSRSMHDMSRESPTPSGRFSYVCIDIGHLPRQPAPARAARFLCSFTAISWRVNAILWPHTFALATEQCYAATTHSCVPTESVWTEPMACGLLEQPPEMQMVRRASFHRAYRCLFSRPREVRHRRTFSISQSLVNGSSKPSNK